jgi:uncharacterized protein (DUF1697 family)
MENWIALLRGVNVGGRNKLPMKALVAELEAMGLADVKTYIQSGNVVLRCAKARAANLGAEIAGAINEKFGFLPNVVVINAKDLAKAKKANPYPEADNETDGKRLHFIFLASVPRSIDADRLNAVRRPSEQWQIKGTVFYLHTPEGFGDSKLANQVEKILGVTTTARNLLTVNALLELAQTSTL